MRYRLALLFVAILVAASLGSGLLGPGGVASGQDPPPEQLIRPAEAESYVWPYTSRSHSVEGRTLALNVVIVGTPDDVRTILMDRSELEWTTADEDHSVNDTVSIADINESLQRSQDNESGSQAQLDGSGSLGQLNESVSISPWQTARGSSRYTYVADNLSSGEWVEADYQLATGAYLGSRTHIRAYPGPSDNWTALQAHTEYWDWFRLRHSVTGISEGGRTVERDLRDEPFVAEVNRVYHGNGGGGSDGWLSVIRLTSANWSLVPSASAEESTERPSSTTLGVVGIVPAAAVLAVAASPVRRRDLRELRDLALPIALIALVLGVRSLGIVAEGVFPATNPKVFAGLLYPVLVAGPLVASWILARNRPATRIALLAAVGLGAGFVLDLGSVGVSVVPIQLVLQRTALMGTLGLFTLGVADGDRQLAGIGVVLWLGVLAATLLGMV
ncbi:hypothetical protein [Halobellus captivus]|uniref:hypothetical protein n=1 Tax=Halobellus captivus TaxID=2592614 RepID=UPI00119F7648|nr:hypothetical protein [Halobellus captivus]